MTTPTAAPFTAVAAPELAIDKLLYRGNPVPANGKLERRIAANLLAFMASKGWNVCTVFDGDELVPVVTALDVMELAFDLDEVQLTFTNAAGNEHRAVLIMGNGIDIITDWGFTVGDPDGFNAAMEGFDAEDYA
ncbi:hypothetical protein [Pseudomonas sp.]|uniref:hypothetical protein n=1 Tax=Pseudomonas sp. TaxID=306 RepID=UPI003FD79506